MKRLTMLAIMCLVAVFVGQAVVQSAPGGPAEGLNVNVLNTPDVNVVKEPFYFADSLPASASVDGDSTAFEVEEGKRLEIEYMSIKKTGWTGPGTESQKVLLDMYVVTDPPTVAQRAIAIISGEGFNLFGGGQKVLLHAGQGDEVNIRYIRDSSASNETFLVTVTGHLYPEQ